MAVASALLEPTFLSYPGSSRVHAILSSTTTPRDLRIIHSNAIRILEDHSELEDNRSKLIDYAYLGPITHDGATSPALVTYHDCGERSYHSDQCTHKSCLGWNTEEEAAGHAAQLICPVEDRLIVGDEDKYMCRDDETFSRKVLKDWETVRADYKGGQGRKGVDPSHRQAKVKIILPESDPIAEWAKDEYSISGRSSKVYDPSLDERRSVSKAVVKRSQGSRYYGDRYHRSGTHPSRNGDVVETQIEISRKTRSRSSSAATTYRIASALATENQTSPKEQVVGPGTILVRRLSSDLLTEDQKKSTPQLGDSDSDSDSEDPAPVDWLLLESYPSSGKRWHDCSEINPLCRGFEGKTDCLDYACILPTGDKVKILNARCRPGYGYNFEEDLLIALAHKYLQEIEEEPDLGFKDSKTSRLTDVFPRLSPLFEQQIVSVRQASRGAGDPGDSSEQISTSGTASTKDTETSQTSLATKSSDGTD